MSGTYRQGFDGKWPGEPKEDQGTTHPKQDTADVAGTVMEPGDPMDAHDTFLDLSHNTAPASTRVTPSTGAAGLLHKSGASNDLTSRIDEAASGHQSAAVTSGEASKVQAAESASTDEGGLMGKIKGAFGASSSS